MLQLFKEILSITRGIKGEEPSMSKTKIILIRHGQSIGNYYRNFLGHTNLDLTELGYQQAQCCAKYLKDEHIDVIFASDLIRAYNTIMPLAKEKNLEIIRNSQLREIYAGDWENMHVDDIMSKYEKEFTTWKTDIGNCCCTNGESVLHLQDRIYAEILKIANDNLGKTVCIGTHATPIRTFWAKINSMGKDEIKNIPWATNASVTRVEYCDNEFIPVCYSYDEFLGEKKVNMFKNI